MHRVSELENALDIAAAIYEPSQDIAKQLGDKVLTALVAPYAMGKSTVMSKITQFDTDFGQEVGFTTRDPRIGESLDAYRFLPHTKETLEEILGKVETGQLVQFATHKTTKKIYGSEVVDYKKPFNVVDIMASGMSDLMRLPFKKVVSISLVAPVDDWHRWRLEREGNLDTKDIKNRRIEAVSNLEWSLQNETSWVVNRNGRSLMAALEVIGISREQIEPTASNRRIGELLLKAARGLV